MSIFSSIFAPGELSRDGNVVQIALNGVLVVGDSSGIMSQETISSTKIVEFIEEAKEDDDVKAVLFEINSPGGSPVATGEIAQAIKELREETNKTTVAWIREVGASGGYWVSSATEHIVANRMSVVGSIGVIASYLEFAGLLDNYNVTYRRLVAGKYKDLGSPFREMSLEEETLFQEQLDELHDYFIEEVAINRGLEKEKVTEIATGMIFLGSKAKDLGLVDELGGKKQAVKYIEDKLNITANIVEYKEPVSFLHLLRGFVAEHGYKMGEGIGGSFVKGNGGIKT